MKHIYVMICLLLTMSSCQGFLNLQPDDKLTTENFWRNQSDAEQALAAAYSFVENYFGSWDVGEYKIVPESFREDLYELGSDALNYPHWMELYNFTYRSDNAQFRPYWEYCYKGIAQSNQVIFYVSKMTEDRIDLEVRDKIVAEAYFLKAYYYTRLMLNFERVVWNEQFAQDDTQLENPAVSRKVGWDNTIKCLDKAISLNAMSNKGNQVQLEKGRATIESAHAYRALAYLTRAFEETASKEQYLREALKSLDASIYTNCALVSNYESMFNGLNKNCPESIFEAQFTLNTNGGARYHHYLPSFIAIGELGGWDELYPNEKLMNAYKKELKADGSYDNRLYASIYFDDPKVDDMMNEKLDIASFASLFKNPEAVHPSFRKFLPEDLNTVPQKSEINVPTMRYSNVLLMRAEVNKELGNLGEAIADINTVRVVHGGLEPMTSTNVDEVQAQIEHQRMLEFPLEGYRFHDLRRWGKLEETYAGTGRNFDVDKHSFYPIPQAEENANGAL